MIVIAKGEFKLVRVRACDGDSILGEAIGQALPLPVKTGPALVIRSWNEGTHQGTKDDNGLKIGEA